MRSCAKDLLRRSSYQPRPDGAWATVIVGTVVAVVVSPVASPLVASAQGDPNPSDTLDHSSPTAQTQCPVMVGNAIDPTLFATYRGKKVYFCCPSCKIAFAKDPQAYVHRLPQFASVSGEPHGDHGHEHLTGDVSLAGLVAPMGIATLSLVALTVLLGVLRRVKRLRPRLLLRIHKTTGVIALISGLGHAALVLFAH